MKFPALNSPNSKLKLIINIFCQLHHIGTICITINAENNLTRNTLKCFIDRNRTKLKNWLINILFILTELKHQLTEPCSEILIKPHVDTFLRECQCLQSAFNELLRFVLDFIIIKSQTLWLHLYKERRRQSITLTVCGKAMAFPLATYSKLNRRLYLDTTVCINRRLYLHAARLYHHRGS